MDTINNKVCTNVERFIRNVLHVKDDELVKAALLCTETVAFNKGDIVVRQGEPSLNLDFMMTDGLVRGFYYDDKAEGKEITECFVCTAGSCIADHFDPNEESNHNSMLTVKVLEDAVFLRLSRKDAKLLFDNFPECQALAYRKLNEAVNSHIYFKRMLASYKGEELVQQFSNRYYELSQKLSVSEIASLLNVSERTVFRSKLK